MKPQNLCGFYKIRTGFEFRFMASMSLFILSMEAHAGTNVKSQFSHFAGGFVLTLLLMYVVGLLIHKYKPKALVIGIWISMIFVLIDQALDFMERGKFLGQVIDFLSHAAGTFLAGYMMRNKGAQLSGGMDNQHQTVLNDALLIGKGTKRKCYQHPDDPMLCIKVSSGKGLRSAKRETRYLKLLHRRGKSVSQIADYKGVARTNIGDGDVFEMVRDYDGSVSKNIEHYLRLGDATITAKILDAIEALRRYLLTESILFSDLSLANILVKVSENGDYKLIIIDGVGDNNHIQFLEYQRWLGVKRCIRKWAGFVRNVERKFPQVAKEIRPFVS